MNKSIGISQLGQNSVNEDSILIDDELGLYIVADGVGGMTNGDIASSMACENIHQSILSGKSLSEAIMLCHELIQSYAKNNFSQNMATTIAAVFIKDNKYKLAWVGSSRVYLWDGNLKLLTRDDTFIESLLKYKIITLEQSKKYADKKVITQAVGMDSDHLYIHTNKGYLTDQQYLLLTTDGFHQNVDEKSIINTLKKHAGYSEISENLFFLASENEAKDDMSFIIVQGNKPTIDLGETCPDIIRSWD